MSCPRCVDSVGIRILWLCTEEWMTILESGWNLWVCLVGVISRRWVWLVDGIYGYGYHVLVWLVGGVVRTYIDILTMIINFPYSTCISSFFGSSIPTSLFIFKMFFCLVSVILFNNI